MQVKYFIASTLLSIVLTSMVLNPNKVYAGRPACPSGSAASGFDVIVPASASQHQLVIDFSDSHFDKSKEYFIEVGRNAQSEKFHLKEGEVVYSSNPFNKKDVRVEVVDGGTKAIVTLYGEKAIKPWPGSKKPTPHYVTIQGGVNCDLGVYFTEAASRKDRCVINVYQERGGKQCFAPKSCLDGAHKTFLTLTQVTNYDGSPYTGKLFVNGNSMADVSVSNGSSKPFQLGRFKDSSTYTIKVFQDRTGTTMLCSFEFKTQSACTDDSACQESPRTKNDIQESEPYKICDQIPDDVPGPNNTSAKQACINCLGPNGSDGIWTAVGCIKSDPTKLIQALIRLGLGAAGGVALLSLLAGGFMFSVSEGDPKRVGQAKEMIVASLSGLLFIIFSVTLLQFVGWNILKIPGFGG